MTDWKLYQGTQEPHDGIADLPDPPPWRDFRDHEKKEEDRGRNYRPRKHEIELVNAALYLRRPIYVTGPPGCGKSSLAYAVAHELKLGKVLRWSINSRSSLGEGLYHYDALARLRDLQAERGSDSSPTSGGELHDIGRYIKLAELGTALLPRERPRVLLIDEIDKADIDLPNDLLHVFEEGEFEIPELVRVADVLPEVGVMPCDGRDPEDVAKIRGGRVHCRAFPFVVLTSNGERELSPALLRRCLRLDIPAPDAEQLRRIIDAHLAGVDVTQVEHLLEQFLRRRDDRSHVIATDQLLNAIFLVTGARAPEEDEKDAVVEILLRELDRR